MELTREQLKTILQNAPPNLDKRKIVEGLIAKGANIEGVAPEDTARVRGGSRVVEAQQTNAFEDTKPKNFLEKTRDFAVSVIGGGKVAEGAGKGIAAGQTQKELGAAQDAAIETQGKLIKRIKEKEAAGEDASRLKAVLTELMADMKVDEDASQDLVEDLPSNKEVIGSAARLAATVAAPAIGKGAAKVVGPAEAGLIPGAAQGAKIGAITGAGEGALQGGAVALEHEGDAGDVALGALGGGAAGAVTGGALGGAIGGLSGKLKANANIKAERAALLTSKPDSRVAKYTMDGQGRIKTDPVAKEAIKQGVDEGTVATIKGASASDKAKASKMLDILEQGRRDPKFKATTRPADVVGDSVLERFKVVESANKRAAGELDGVAKGLKGQKVDTTPAVRSFMDDLEDMGVKFVNGKPDFKGSDLEGLAGPQKTLQNIIKRMTEVSDDAYDIHRLKRFIDENVEYGKAGEGLAGRTEGILKRLRSNLDGTLDTTFPEYNRVNTTYSTTREAIDELADVAGTRFNPNDAKASARIGTLARRILSNAQSRTDVLNILQKLQDVAEANGGKFDDDIVTQTVFVNDIERLFGTQAPTSLAGEVAKGVQKAKGVTGKLRNAQGLFDLALDVGADTIEGARNINEEGLIKALRELLK